jgi:hypothetical protein
MVVGGQHHAPTALPRERHGTYCIGGWVGPKGGLDGCWKSRPQPGFNPRIVQPAVSRNTDCAIPALYHTLFYHISPHYLITRTIIGREGRGVLLSIKCVLTISKTFVCSTHLILWRTARDIIQYNCLHIKYPLFLSDFNETWIFSMDFRKILRCKL